MTLTRFQIQRLTNRLLALLLLLMAGTTSVLAETASIVMREDMAALGQRAERWLLDTIQSTGDTQDADIKVQAGMLDARTQLSKCQRPINIDFAPGQGIRAKTNLSLLCPDRPGWRLFLPMTITRRSAVWVARNSIATGTALQSSQWQRELRDIAGLPASAITNNDLSGYQTRMTIAAGAVLTQALVSGKTLVKRGQSLTLIASQGNIAITATVEALDNGAVGERIHVRNTASGRVIEAEVVSAEQVRTVLTPTP